MSVSTVFVRRSDPHIHRFWRSAGAVLAPQQPVSIAWAATFIPMPMP